MQFILVWPWLATYVLASHQNSSDMCSSTGGAGICYVGTMALKKIPNIAAIACCNACTSYPSSPSAPKGCGAWELQFHHVENTTECVLKPPGARRVPCHGQNRPNTSASGSLDPPTPPGPSHFKPLYSVTAGKLSIPGLICQPSDPHVDIYYPSDLSRSYQVVVFGHGSGGNVRGFANPLDNSLIGFVAGMGMIVLAAEPTRVGEACSPDTEWQDMLRVLDACKANRTLHAALAHADFTSTGIFGHSMGAEASPLAANAALDRGGYGLKAMLSSHSWFKGQDSIDAVKNLTGIATMFTSCENDGHHAAANKIAFESCPGRPKVFANLVNGSHMEPIHGGRNNEFDARFLACHVASHTPSCNAIYNNNTMCKLHDYVDCDIVMK